MTHGPVQVVIVNWNGREFLGDCLRAVQAQIGIEVAPVVIDNGSTDDSLAFLAAEFPSVPCVRAPRNNYTAANNLGVARAPGDYALLLNTDTVLAPDCVQRLAMALHGEPRAGVAGPKLVFPDGRLASTGIAEREDLYWFDRDEGAPDPGGGGAPERVLGVSGCCALFRVAAWRQIGGQDEAFHMYYEDVDVALSLRAAGWSSLYVPSARCLHVGHGSIRKASTWKDELGERNRLLVLARHFADRLPALLVRSPWFQSAPPEQVRALLPLVAARLGRPAGAAAPAGGEVALLLDLMLALRDSVRAFACEPDTPWGEHRALPQVITERERWIAMLLQEISRPRWFGLRRRHLSAEEVAFLARVRARQERAP